MPQPGQPQDVRQRRALFSHNPEENPFLPNQDPLAGGMGRPAPTGRGGSASLMQSRGSSAQPNPQQTAELARLQAMVLPNRMVQPQPPQPPQPPGFMQRLQDMLNPTAPGRTFGYRGYDPEQNMLLDQFNKVNTGAPGVPSAARVFSGTQGLIRALLRPEQQYTTPGGI